MFCKDSSRIDGLYPWCKNCRKVASRKQFEKNRDRCREKTANWRANNLERARELSRLAHQKHKDKRNAASKLYREQNREKVRALCLKWGKENPARAREINADRRARKNQAIPTWADDEFDKLVVAEMFDLGRLRTKATGVKWHVDHIVPLRNKRVCGLHCAANLQVITAEQNHIKGNRVWPNM
jgi:hypothetical protein